MRLIVRAAVFMLTLSALAEGTLSQELKTPVQEKLPVATEWLLKGTKLEQHNAITSVLLLRCPKSHNKGTAFIIKGGIVVTSAHVIKGCGASDLLAQSPMNKAIRFSKSKVDEQRDLAILLPTEILQGGLELGSDRDPPVKSQVFTWGFPLSFNGPPPLLSMGYVAGYVAEENNGRIVKHLVVNGAFNPGNSGGPLLMEDGSNKVIGIVVNRSLLLLSKNADFIIKGLESARSGIKGTFVRNLPDGTKESIYDSHAVGAVLREFYNEVQVMIGEAIAVSELRAFLKENEKQLRQ